MAYPPAPQYPQSPPPGPKTRPAVVSAVVWTQVLIGVAVIVAGAGYFSIASGASDLLAELLAEDPSWQESGYSTDQLESAVVLLFGIWAGVYVLFGIFHFILAPLVYAGKRPARILSWILAGLALLCCGPATLLNEVGNSTQLSSGGTELDAEMTQSILDAVPTWATVAAWVAVVLLFAGSLLVVILLAVPASNEFFRKNEPPMGPYMGQQPGQPPYGQQPPGPGQPPYGQQPPSGEPPYGQPPQQ
jgi:hypothetical protein